MLSTICFYIVSTIDLTKFKQYSESVSSLYKISRRAERSYYIYIFNLCSLSVNFCLVCVSFPYKASVDMRDSSFFFFNDAVPSLISFSLFSSSLGSATNSVIYCYIILTLHSTKFNKFLKLDSCLLNS